MTNPTSNDQPPTDPATGEYALPEAPNPKRRRIRTAAAAAAAAAVAGLSGYAVGHVTADDSSSTASQVDDGQQGFPGGGQPPNGQPPSGAPTGQPPTDQQQSDQTG